MYTVGQFIAETYSFPYSREYFEILREEYEWNLRQKYERSINFQRTSQYQTLVESGYIDESYFLEKKYFQEDSNDNKPSFFDKFLNFLKKIWNGICSIIGKIANGIKDFFFGTSESRKYENTKKEKRLEIDTKYFTKDEVSKIVKEIESKFGKSALALFQNCKIESRGSLPNLKFDGDIDANSKTICDVYHVWKYGTESSISVDLEKIDGSGETSVILFSTSTGGSKLSSYVPIETIAERMNIMIQNSTMDLAARGRGGFYGTISNNIDITRKTFEKERQKKFQIGNSLESFERPEDRSVDFQGLKKSIDVGLESMKGFKDIISVDKDFEKKSRDELVSKVTEFLSMISQEISRTARVETLRMILLKVLQSPEIEKAKSGLLSSNLASLVSKAKSIRTAKVLSRKIMLNVLHSEFKDLHGQDRVLLFKTDSSDIGKSLGISGFSPEASNYLVLLLSRKGSDPVYVMIKYDSIDSDLNDILGPKGSCVVEYD